MRVRLAFFFLLVLLPCPASAQRPLDRVPLRYLPPTLVIEARVNGSKLLFFAFDTGTTTIVLDVQVAAQMGLQPPAGDRRAAPGPVRIRSLAVGKAVAYDLEAVIRDLTPLSQRMGHELAGIIGYPWMEQFIFEINHATGRLTLWPRQAELSAPAHTLVVPLEVQTGPGFGGAGLFVSGQVNAEPCEFEIDTGTDIGVLGAGIARRVGTTISAPRPSEPLPQSPSIRRVDLLMFGGRVFAHVPFRIDPNRGASGEPYQQCVIGNDQLQEFVLTIDIPHRRAFFRSLPRAENAR